MANAPEDIDDIIRDLGRGLKLIEDMSPGYKLAKAYHDGTAAEFSSSPVLEEILKKSAEKHPVSFAHVPVDAKMDKVELANITTEEERVAELVAQWFDDNDLEDEADDWARKTGIFGDYYVILDPRSEDAAGRANLADVRPIGSSPLSTVMVYDGKDSRKPLFGVKRWQVGSGEKAHWEANLFYDDQTVQLVTEKGTGEGGATKADAYTIAVDENDEELRISHLGGRPLLIHYAVDGKPYGTPLHRKAYGPQDAITKVSATNLANVDGQGFASRWALSDPAAPIDDEIDADFGTDAPNTAAGKSDGRTDIAKGTRVRTVPGAIAILKGIKQVGQFTATGSEDFLKNLDWYVRAMAVACGVPLFEFDLSGEQPSGESRRRASARLNKHVRKIKRAIGRSHKQLFDTLLGTAGLVADVQVNWMPTEVETDKDGLELVAQKIKAGVPVVKALSEAGYSEAEIAEWYPEGDPHVTPELLPIFADALQKLGQAVTLGAIDPIDVARMLPTVLSVVAEPPAPAATAGLDLPIVTDPPREEA